MSSTGVHQPEEVPRVSTLIGRAYQVPIRSFLDYVLPELPEDLKVEDLISSNAFPKAITKEHKLYGYTNKTPSGAHRFRVDKAFMFLQRNIRYIMNIKRPDATLVFHNNKDSEANFDRRAEDAFPDAFFIPVDIKFKAVRWRDIRVCGEYQRKHTEESVQENIKKISRSLLNIMRLDPCRRFTFAFTAEDASMKLWYCDRSQVVVSEPFNFIEDCRVLLHFVLSVTLAEPHRLGCDPTMVLVDRDGQPQYDIMIRSIEGNTATYRTLGVLSDTGAHHVLGRGTRVWKAVQIANGEETGPPVALKDAWVDNNRQREGSIHSQVMGSDFLVKERRDLQKYFITVQAHGDVFVGNKQDRTPTYFDCVSSLDTEKAHFIPHQPRASAPTTDNRHHLVHYRIVYGEVGESLSEIQSLRKLFGLLVDVVYGLGAMHKSGWVHRDLSIGNILVVDGVGKITDLEYATSELRQGKAGRTGTAYFLATEVDAEAYLFQTMPTPKEVELPEALTAAHILRYGSPEVLPDLDDLFPTSEIPHYEFRYNPLHDLESLWWIAVYFVVNREVDGEKHAGCSYADSIAQRRVASEFFYQRDCRNSAMSFPGYFAERIRLIHPCLSGIGHILEDMRAVLVLAYTAIEKSIDSITFDAAEGIYEKFLIRLKRAADLAQDTDIRRFGSVHPSMAHRTDDS